MGQGRVERPHARGHCPRIWRLWDRQDDCARISQSKAESQTSWRRKTALIQDEDGQKICIFCIYINICLSCQKTLLLYTHVLVILSVILLAVTKAQFNVAPLAFNHSNVCFFLLLNFFFFFLFKKKKKKKKKKS